MSLEDGPPSARKAAPEKRKRRGRPPKIHSEHLLAIARQVFLERGISATTLEVAERAGVSEGTLFHRFKTKEGLFRQALQLPEEELPDRLIEAVDSISGQDIRESLDQLAEALLTIGRAGIPLMMMSWSSPTCRRTDDKNLLRYRLFMERLIGFFEAEIAAGRLRPMDPEVIARTFLGAIHHHCMSCALAPDPTWILPEKEYVRGLVDLVLWGAQPSTSTNFRASAVGATPPIPVPFHHPTDPKNGSAK